MSTLNQYVVFNLDEQFFALRLAAVERVIRSVGVTPLPGAPEIVSGAVNLQGRIVPVFNVRRRFGLPEGEMELSDQIIIARTHRRAVALLVDGVRGVHESPAEEVKAEEILPGMKYVEGIMKLPDGIVLIHDLDKFLSLEEEKALDEVTEVTKA
ncbi:MAG: purine-binding chemotaxis protein CheW [Acidobacteria bacterium]|nr:purine-binding chemotaxis protein CheW [Acidobacteriota bacterium]